MESKRPKTSVGNNGKHGGVTANHYESTIRDLNETVYRLYKRIEELIQENNELSQLRKSEYKSKS